MLATNDVRPATDCTVNGARVLVDGKIDGPIPSRTPRNPQALHYGNGRAPLARIVPDDRSATMWRIAWPDGRTSDLTNITRAKDAATAIAERGPPVRNRRCLHWIREASNSPPERRWCVFLARPVQKTGGEHG